jgi:hypothetical protein
MYLELWKDGHIDAKAVMGVYVGQKIDAETKKVDEDGDWYLDVEFYDKRIVNILQDKDKAKVVARRRDLLSELDRSNR